MKNLIPLTALLSLLAPAATGQVFTLAGWTFDSLSVSGDPSQSPVATGGSLLAKDGAGTATGFHALTATIWATQSGNGSPKALSANNWNIGDYFQFQVSTIGYRDVALSYDQASSSTGPRGFRLEYSVDGSSFSPFGVDYTVLQNTTSSSPQRTSWSSTAERQAAYTFAFDLSAVDEVENADNVYFRIVNTSTVSISGGTVASTGTDRIDNFIVTATPVPEPQDYALVAGTALVLFAVWRRRKRALA